MGISVSVMDGPKMLGKYDDENDTDKSRNDRLKNILR